MIATTSSIVIDTVASIDHQWISSRVTQTRFGREKPVDIVRRSVYGCTMTINTDKVELVLEYDGVVIIRTHVQVLGGVSNYDAGAWIKGLVAQTDFQGEKEINRDSHT